MAKRDATTIENEVAVSLQHETLGVRNEEARAAGIQLSGEAQQRRHRIRQDINTENASVQAALFASSPGSGVTTGGRTDVYAAAARWSTVFLATGIPEYSDE